jgi:hypothetical protein
MKHIGLVLSVLFLIAVMGYSSSATSAEAKKPKGVKPGVTYAVALNKAATYCHLKFPSIRTGALGAGAKPTVKDLTGPEVDFYGACDHDPIGFDEVCRQTADLRRAETCD